MKRKRHVVVGKNKICIDFKNINDWTSEIDFETGITEVTFNYIGLDKVKVLYDNNEEAEEDFKKIRKYQEK